MEYGLDSCWRVGAAIVSLSRDSLLYGAGESVALAPASTIKLVTVACALESWDDSLVARVERRLSRSRDPDHARLLDSARVDSPDVAFPDGPPGYRYLVWTNHMSDNRLAEWLAEETARPARTEPSRMLEGYLRDRGIPCPGLVIRDGSGRSPLNRVAPVTLARLLSRMHASSYAGLYRRTLPCPGSNGTLRRRGLGLGSRVRAKTGYLRSTFALAGYLAAERDDYAFCLIVNDCPDARSGYRLFTRILLDLFHWDATRHT